MSLWKAVVVAAVTAILLFLAAQTSHLLAVLAVAVFFALALIPGVNHMHERWGWRRGAAVGLVYAGLVVFVAGMITNSGRRYDVVYHGKYDSDERPSGAAPQDNPQASANG